MIAHPLPAPDEQVCVIIAARNAERTIARAVRSALTQAMVSELIVVDDASDDRTAAEARAADDGSGRLEVIVLAANVGPAGARNIAISHGAAPFIAVLDADDFLLPGRFEPLLARPGWDIIADNIAFVPEALAGHFDPETLRRDDSPPRTIDLATFILGNVSRAGRARGELGFAKPVIRRAILDAAGVRYDESLWLGEDYALYLRLLAAGARFVTVRDFGYVALVRPKSLSGNHRTADLAALLAFDERFAATADLAPPARAAWRRHRDQLARKLHLRRMLDLRQSRGRWRAMLGGLGNPRLLPGLVADVARDKLANVAPRHQQEVHHLF
jgi:succinoglycan biosynthesis protein ExoU